MADTSLLSPLEAALDQSLILLNLAKEQNWEAFEVLLQQRQASMNALTDKGFLQAIAKADLDEQAKTLVIKIQDINRQLTDLSTKKRDQVVAEIRQINTVDKVAGLYGQ